MSRAALLKRLALEEGFELAGICRASPSEHNDFLKNWIDHQRHGSMEYMARLSGLTRRADLRTVLPSVETVLVVGHNYYQQDPEGVPDEAGRAVVARYARGRDYHRVVKSGLERVHRRLEMAEGRLVPAKSYVDTGPILERELAQRAGLGWFGQNTMLIHPRQGSYFFLGVLLLAVDAQPDDPIERDHCGSCNACLERCPTTALLGRDGLGGPVMDASRCISYLTIEHRGPIPMELRPLIENRIYGCDICQEVCPFNVRFATQAAEPAYAARGPGQRPAGVEREGGRRVSLPSTSIHPGTDGPPLIDLMAMDEGAWEQFSRGSAIRRVGRAGFLRNVAVALGNWGSADALPALTGALSADPLVRGHVAWALGQVGSNEAQGALERARDAEGDPWVCREIDQALALVSSRVRARAGGTGEP